jgi:diphthamide synthase (EF-2-diphthine--ammonia ligase)
MTDILADYREWRASLEDRIGTHSAGCHMWPRHERCMIHRLAAALAAEQARRTDACELHARESQRLQPDRTPEDDEIERLREAIRRLAEQDATLSVCDGNVTVTMDATLTDEERVAIAAAADDYLYHQDPGGRAQHIERTLRGLLERTGPTKEGGDKS